MCLPKRILMEMVPGTNRQLGRPRKRWEDDIIAGSTFLEAYRNAEDRNRWADFVLGHGAKIDRYIVYCILLRKKEVQIKISLSWVSTPLHSCHLGYEK